MFGKSRSTSKALLRPCRRRCGRSARLGNGEFRRQSERLQAALDGRGVIGVFRVGNRKCDHDLLRRFFSEIEQPVVCYRLASRSVGRGELALSLTGKKIEADLATVQRGD